MEAAVKVGNWEAIDRAARVFAKHSARRSGREAMLICAIIREEVWRHCNCVTLWEYLEEVFGYGPRTARDRVRVALALQELPLLAEALAQGQLSYSAVRELTRVVQPNTQTAWLEAAHGKNLRQIEDLVVEHEVGDLPTDPRDPSLRTVKIVLEVSQAHAAQFAEMQRRLADAHGERLDDDRLIETMCAAVLDENSNEASRPRHQIATTICAECNAGWQDGGGRVARMSATEIERAECDAQRIGSIEAPTRAKPDVSPMTRRTVWRREHGKCVVPGCRSARNLDLHHIVGRASGGSHEADNLVLLCGGHHALLHENKLSISGRVPDVVIEKKPTHTFLRHGVYRKTEAGFDRQSHDVDPLTRLVSILDGLSRAHVGS